MTGDSEPFEALEVLLKVSVSLELLFEELGGGHPELESELVEGVCLQLNCFIDPSSNGCVALFRIGGVWLGVRLGWVLAHFEVFYPFPLLT